MVEYFSELHMEVVYTNRDRCSCLFVRYVNAWATTCDLFDLSYSLVVVDLCILHDYNLLCIIRCIDVGNELGSSEVVSVLKSLLRRGATAHPPMLQLDDKFNQP